MFHITLIKVSNLILSHMCTRIRPSKQTLFSAHLNCSSKYRGIALIFWNPVSEKHKFISHCDALPAGGQLELGRIKPVWLGEFFPCAQMHRTYSYSSKQCDFVLRFQNLVWTFWQCPFRIHTRAKHGTRSHRNKSFEPSFRCFDFYTSSILPYSKEVNPFTGYMWNQRWKSICRILSHIYHFDHGYSITSGVICFVPFACIFVCICWLVQWLSRQSFGRNPLVCFCL